MKRWLVLLNLAFLFVVFPMVSVSAQTAAPAKPAPAATTAKPVVRAPAKPSPNDELIKLAMAGMEDDILIATIEKTGREKYDTSADALLKLQTAGVSKVVIRAILGVASAPVSAPVASAPASLPQTTSPSDGVRAVAEDYSLPTTAEPGMGTNLYFTIFISAPQRDGFFDTSKDIQDSIKDIRKQLSKEKNVNLTVIDDRSKADVILTIVERGIGAQAYGQRVEFNYYYGGTNLEQTPMVATTYWVSSVIQVGAYRKEFTGIWSQDQGGWRLSFGAWGICANQIAVNVASWTKTNAVLMNRYKLAAAGK